MTKTMFLFFFSENDIFIALHAKLLLKHFLVHTHTHTKAGICKTKFNLTTSVNLKVYYFYLLLFFKL